MKPFTYPDDPKHLPEYNIAWPSILGSDGVWYNATSLSISGDTLVMSASGPSSVTAVATAYAYGNWPVSVLYNGMGFPAWPWQRWM